MTGLTLTLKPREKFLVGGMMVENGPKRSSIRIEDDQVFVLRLSDALHPDAVCTPVTRAYHVVQQILACEVTADDGVEALTGRLAELTPIFVRAGHEESMVRIAMALSERRYFGVLMGLKALIAVEAEMLGLSSNDGSGEAERQVA